MLFADAPEVELIWQGKLSEVTSVVLPFQSIEQIGEPRSESTTGKTLDLFGADARSGRQSSGWTKKLIWGDNKLVLSSLKNGPLRREIEAAHNIPSPSSSTKLGTTTLEKRMTAPVAW